MVFSEDFGRQMRFIAGPRQAGKTSLAKEFLKLNGFESLYFNWDQRNVKEMFYKDPHFFQNNVFQTKKIDNAYWLCFDEIHKMPKWKDILKDSFDSFHEEIHFIVSGSAKLDIFRKSGDSLAGRYFLFRLFPLTLNELIHKGRPISDIPSNAIELIQDIFESNNNASEIQENLLEFSGFPEPFLKQKKQFHNLWKTHYIDRLIKEDLRDLTRIMELEKIAVLMRLLPFKVGSPLSLNSLVNDLFVSYTSVKNYMHALEMSYIIFNISPYSKSISRSIKKEKKCYFFDWTHIENEAARFENYIAMQIFSWISLLQDSGFGNFELNYLRTKDGKETDFLIVKNSQPWLLLEVKTSQGKIESHHIKNAKILKVPFIQLTKEEGVAEKRDSEAFQVSASRFFSGI